MYTSNNGKVYFKISASLSKRALPLKFFARIFPLGSSRRFWGIDLIPYIFETSLSQYLRSETWVQVRPSFSIAFSQFCLPCSLSSDTPRTVNPLSLKSLNAFTTFGFSARQGPHQDAQKSIRTYFPLKSDSLTGFQRKVCQWRFCPECFLYPPFFSAKNSCWWELRWKKW